MSLTVGPIFDLNFGSDNGARKAPNWRLKVISTKGSQSYEEQLANRPYGGSDRGLHGDFPIYLGLSLFSWVMALIYSSVSLSAGSWSSRLGT